MLDPVTAGRSSQNLQGVSPPRTAPLTPGHGRCSHHEEHKTLRYRQPRVGAISADVQCLNLYAKSRPRFAVCFQPRNMAKSALKQALQLEAVASTHLRAGVHLRYRQAVPLVLLQYFCGTLHFALLSQVTRRRHSTPTPSNALRADLRTYVRQGTRLRVLPMGFLSSQEGISVAVGHAAV